ncbi:NlpC/P60 family protein [Geodermatophilus sp. URMC 64]
MRLPVENGTGRRTLLRWATRVTGVAVATLVGLGIAPGVAAARPQDPSDSELRQARTAADAAAAEVGRISAQIASAQAQVEAAHAQANIALDTFLAKQAEYEAAQTAAAAADAAARQAQADLAGARSDVATFARDSYMSGSTSSRLTGLLSSGSPAQMLERAALLDAAGDHRADVLTRVTVVEQQAERARGAAQTALTTADTLQQDASEALDAATALETDAREQAAAVETQRAQLEEQLDAAQDTLADLQGERAAADAYDREQAAAAAEAVADEPEPAPAPAPAPAPGPAPAPEPAPSGGDSAGPAPSSAAEGAIAAAQRWLGTRYAWGGGSLSGPSMGWGIDAGVVGFDCSGLTRYAYYQAGISIPRTSRDQYRSLPKVSRSNLQRGDLVFWASNTGNPSTIYHVAIWLGDGRILEAPESGKTVRIASMRWSGFIGGARPGA